MDNKILMFIDSLGSGGAQRQFVGLACFLKESKYNVKVLTYFDIPFYKYILDEYGIENSVVQGADNHKKRIRLVNKGIADYAPDIVIAYQETPSIIACIIKMLGAKWKLITSERNTTQINSWKEHLRFNLYRRADFVIPNSYSQERFIKNNYPFLEDKTITIHNFVDLAQFSPLNRKKCNKKVEVVVVASIWESKNTLVFIKAVAMLVERTNNFHIRWYGKVNANIEYINKCEALIAKLGVGDYIELLDKTKEIANKYRESDVFCLPSFYEGTPNVICEAMACGLPIVCSDVCDNSIYVKENVNGWLFNPSLPADIADKLFKAIESTAELRHEYSKQSRLIAETVLSKERFTKKYIDLLDSFKK